MQDELHSLTNKHKSPLEAPNVPRLSIESIKRFCAHDDILSFLRLEAPNLPYSEHAKELLGPLSTQTLKRGPRRSRSQLTIPVLLSLLDGLL